tara:strand:- start:704 stop:832 length:129 start_codon:yes stop_codon:yes gene_type:complete
MIEIDGKLLAFLTVGIILFFLFGGGVLLFDYIKKLIKKRKDE